MRRLAAALLATTALLLGCGGPSDETPVACREGAGAYLKALASAPQPVRLQGEVAISDCLAQNQKAGDLATVGTAVVKAATALNAEGRADTAGGAPLRLGYLVGAAARGAERTSGIHADLIRRLQAAAVYSPGGSPLPGAYRRAYERGFEAGHEHG
jgi:hypothetical protein